MQFSVSPSFHEPIYPGQNVTIHWENPDHKSDEKPESLTVEYFAIDADGAEVRLEQIAENQSTPGSTWFVIPEKDSRKEFYIKFREGETTFYKQFLNVSPANKPVAGNEPNNNKAVIAVGGALTAVALFALLTTLYIFCSRKRRQRKQDRRRSIDFLNFRKEKGYSCDSADLPIYQMPLSSTSTQGSTPTRTPTRARANFAAANVESVYVSHYDADAESIKLSPQTRPVSIETHPYSPGEDRPSLSLATVLESSQPAYELPTQSRTPADEIPAFTSARRPSSAPSTRTYATYASSAVTHLASQVDMTRAPALPELKFLSHPPRPGMSPRINFRLDTGVDGRDSTGLTAVTPATEKSYEGSGLRIEFK